MEEVKKPQETKKFSYDELKQSLSDLHIQYQKLMAEYKRTLEALQAKEFDNISFLLHSLFKVLDHPELFKDEFVKWSVDNIQGALTSFAEGLQGNPDADSARQEDSQKKANEAE